MSRRALAFTSVLLASAAAAAAGVASCSPAPVASTAVCETGTPTLSIVSPSDHACLELSGSPSDFIPVVVNAASFQIRAPGSCNGCTNCGHLVLRVNDVDNNASSSSVVDVSFAPVNLPLSHYGELKLTVEIVDDCGNPWAPPNVDGGALDCNPRKADAGAAHGAPLLATVTVTTKPSCGASSSSASSSSASSSSAASSSSTGGTGGAGSSSASGTGGASSSSSSGTGGAGGMDAGTGGAGDAGTGDAGDAGDAGAGDAGKGDAGDAGDGG